MRLTRRERGESLWASHVVSGLKLGAFPRNGLIVAEGRLAVLTTGEAPVGWLAAPTSIGRGAERASMLLGSLLTLDVGCLPLVRRLDLAGDVIFEDPADGLRVLAALGGLQLPRHKQSRHSGPNQVASVGWSRGSNIALRAYDAGRHHGTHAPGTRIRVERQMRFRRSAQLPPAAFPTERLAADYVSPVRTLIDAASAALVLGPAPAERMLDALAAEGGLAVARYERLLGVVSVLARGRDATVWDRDTATRRRRELRQHGINLDLSGEEAQRDAMRIGDVLGALADAWHSGADRPQTGAA